MMAEERLCQTTEEVRELLGVNDNGQMKNTMQNAYQVFLSDPALHGAIAYNILTGRIDICKPLWWERTVLAMSDTDFNYLIWSGMAQSTFPMCSITSWVQKSVRMAPKSCGCFCWEPFTGYLDWTASLN